MTVRSLVLAAGLGIMTLSAAGCSPSFNLPQREMPAGASFSGLWYTNFGEMKLTQRNDGSVNGTFAYKTGGEVTGRVEGGVLIFDWIQPGDFQVGRREVRGKGYLVISDDGLNMSGRWGYDDYESGGEWSGQKATEVYR